MPMPAPLSPIRIATGAVVLGGREVLAPLQLELHEARIAVIGRNGSGKTTLLRLMAGLQGASSGHVTLGAAAIDVLSQRKAALREIGILFQNPDHQILFPTVAEELAFGLTQLGRSRRDAQARVEALLADEGRSHWASQPVTSLSGGQKQLVCLWSLMLMAPHNLLLDEPFSGLDLPTVLRLERRLLALPQRLITITHDPARLLGAERVLWLDAGRLRADGPPAQVVPAYIAAMTRLGDADADADLAL